MFFRLCNSPMTFQMMMNDILVYSRTLSDHQQIVHQVLSTLQEWRLFLKPEKCKFEQKEVEYLRLVILKDHITMDPMKVCGVTEWPTPTKVMEVQSFLGFVNFYQKFIHNFSNITHCQSTTLHTELCASLNISKALPCTLMHHIADSADCTITILPPASVPPHMPLLVVCLFPLPVVSDIDRQWADAKSNCTHCIRRGLGRRLRSSLLLNLSPRCDPVG